MWNFINKYITQVFLLIVAIVTALALVVVWKVDTVQKNTDILSQQVNKLVKITEIKENILLQTAAMNCFIQTGQQEQLDEFRSYTPLNIKMQLELIKTVRESRKPLARGLNNNYIKFVNTFENDVVAHILGGKEIPQQTSRELIEQKNLLISLSTEIQELRQNDTLSIIATTIGDSRNAAKTTEIFTLLGVVAGIALSIVMGAKFISIHKIYQGIISTTRNITFTINEKGLITSFNKTAQDFFELPEGKVVNRRHNVIFGPGQLINLDLPLSGVIESGTGACNMERYYTTGDGWKCVLNVDCLPLSDTSPSGILVVARDISERKVLEEKLYAMTLRDGLTELYNHTYIKRKLHEEIAIAGVNGAPVSFILMDIDNFKFYNDRFGHLPGDYLLKEFGKLLKKTVRESDIIGRYGGDEFAVILPQTDSETALVIAEKIRSPVEKYSFPNKNLMPKGRITVSAGVSIFPKDADNSEEIIKLADEAMYRCKQNSKNEVQLYFSALKDFQRELQVSEPNLFSMVRTLLGIINAKDRDTYLHLEKVSEYTELICGALDLGPIQIKDVKLAAFLHDVGKIEIPRNILNKIGPLTQDEWSIIMQHPKWGASMVRSMHLLDNIIPMIMHHHERYDGKGYPHGLKGEEIPLGSRILAVADSFDAMTNARPYRVAKNYIEALEEIERNRGTQFDPEIADIFIKCYFERMDNYQSRFIN